MLYFLYSNCTLCSNICTVCTQTALFTQRNLACVLPVYNLMTRPHTSDRQNAEVHSTSITDACVSKKGLLLQAFFKLRKDCSASL